MIRKISVIVIIGLLIILLSGGLISGGIGSSKLNFNIISPIEENKIFLNSRAELSYYPEFYDFGDIYKGQEYNTTFEIWNSECCAVYYSISWNYSYIDVFPDSGVCYSGDPPDIINVHLNTTGLVWDSYTCHIFITSNAGDGIFTINFNIINEGIKNLTVGESWDLLSNTTNGVQIPIDVRTYEEWRKEHIDTPQPENPKHHTLTDLQNETKLQEFKNLYYDKELIFYSKTGVDSEIAAQILVDNKFYGTIYNMIGGITAWKEAEYPTKGNQPPNATIITGPTYGIPSIEYNYTFFTTDPEEDDLYYCINWSDDTDEILVGPIAHGTEITLNHSWNERGIYNIKAKAIDQFNAEGIWGNLLVIITKDKLTIKSIFLIRSEKNINLFTI